MHHFLDLSTSLCTNTQDSALTIWVTIMAATKLESQGMLQFLFHQHWSRQYAARFPVQKKTIIQLLFLFTGLQHLRSYFLTNTKKITTITIQLVP